MDWLFAKFSQQLTSMKHTSLSSFQKQQYTNYLETQLQKFSAFMLFQKKQNDKINTYEEVLSHHSNIITQLQHKLSIYEQYQNQISHNQENLFRKYQTIEDLHGRVSKLEDRERFGCDREARKFSQRIKKQQEGKENQGKQNNGEVQYVNLNKRLKIVQEKISKLKQTNGAKIGATQENEVTCMIQDVTQHRVKRLQKKMKKYFTNRFEDIQQMIKKTKKHRSKSPSARTPLEMSKSSFYEIQNSVKPLTQFRLEDSSIHKDQSTTIRDSKTTISNKIKDSDNSNKVRKERKQKEGKQKSRSKSKKNDKKRKQKQSRSKSKSKKRDYSRQFSDNSLIKSSLSKSYVSRDDSQDKIVHRKRGKNRSRLSVSKSKSNHSSISLHQKCKRRPEYDQNPLVSKQLKSIKSRSKTGRRIA